MAAKATALSDGVVTIPQGSNNPLVITFDENVEVSSMTISLWSRRNQDKDVLLKLWTDEDFTIDADTVICPMSEEETSKFPAGYIVLEIKGLDEQGHTIFWQQTDIRVMARKDKQIVLSGDDA